MDITLKNCWNIKEWKIVIEEWKLNLKYAINWTWKTTIWRSIKFLTETDEKKEELKSILKTYWSDEEPEIIGIDWIEKIAIFNEDYVKQYVFKKDEILENSFSIFIENDIYKKWIKEIEELVKNLTNTFEDNQELKELIKDTDNFLSYIKISKTWINKTSTIVKWIEWAKKINQPPEWLEDYQSYLKESSFNSKYIAWQQQWQTFLEFDEEKCPCCISSINVSKKENIKKFSIEYKKAEIDNLNKILDVIDWLYNYFNEITKDEINNIKNNISWITSEQEKFLIALRNEVELFNNKLKELYKINFYQLKDIDNIENKVKEYLLEIKKPIYNYIDSEFTKEKVKILNNELNNLIEKIRELNWKINRQNSILKWQIEKYKTNINNFLISAWYKYEIDVIEDKENNKYKFILKPINLDIEIQNSNKNLSFWEKNAFALVMFMYQSLNEWFNFVILDDPISSFDKNKKFAILNMLFGDSSENFRWKTVLMLTHDFEPIIDTIKNGLPKQLSNNKNAYFLKNSKGVLVEKNIFEDNIKTFNNICKENLKKDINILNKCIFLRRKFEIEDNKWLEYNLLSSLIHKRKIPTKKVYNSETNKMDLIKLTVNEISETSDKIKKYISDFDYNIIYNYVIDNEIIKEIYKKSSSNYEKFQIYRIIKDNWGSVEIDDSVIRKFINESFHIENDYLFQLNPIDYELVPEYIIDVCNEDLNL